MVQHLLITQRKIALQVRKPLRADLLSPLIVKFHVPRRIVQDAVNVTLLRLEAQTLTVRFQLIQIRVLKVITKASLK